MILLTPYVAFIFGVAMMAKALHLYSETRPQTIQSREWKRMLLIWAVLALPSLAQAQAVDRPVECVGVQYKVTFALVGDESA